jgi:site-specific DNA-cytosine methylase
MGDLTCASICSGGKLADIGLMAAGYAPLWGVEPDEAIADVANLNVPAHTARQKAQDVRWARLERPGLLWASPPCPSFSQAKVGGVETAEDEGIAGAICAALRALTPPTFVLENVPRYRVSRSLARIRATLDALGYWTHVGVCNAADYAVPQTRKRLILRAVLGGLVPHLPRPVPWVGWYAAIEDLIPTLPESAFAAWQLARLDRLTDHTLVNQRYDRPQGSAGRRPQPAGGDAPAMTITASDGDRAVRAFLVSGQNAAQEWGNGGKFDPEPSFTVAGAFGDRPSHMPRAILIGGGNTQLAQVDSRPREADAPAFTVAANDSALTNQRAFVVHPSDQRTMPVRDEGEPIWTLTAGSNATRNPDMRPRAWLDEGRVVKMSPRALARFQSVPDSYQLPDRAGLATRIIGNGVCCLLAQRIGEGLRGVLQ